MLAGVGHELERRICDVVTGASFAAGLAALAVSAWLGFVLCAAVAVTAQLIRSRYDEARE